MNKRLLCISKFQRNIHYGIVFLLICFQVGYSQTSKTTQPVISISPLWVAAEYGMYWGISLTGGLIFLKHHKISLCADLAPLGFLGMTDVDTEGKEQHWGGTLSYLFQIGCGNNLIRFEPGVTIGLTSIPYIYGTFPDPDNDITPSIAETRPERETVFGLGPELRISIGRNNVQFFMAGRTLFAEKYNTVLLTNMGISINCKRKATN